MTVVLLDIAGRDAWSDTRMGPVLFMILWAFIPFGVLPSILKISKKTLFTSVLVTCLSWIGISVYTGRAIGGADIGFGLFMIFLYPPSIILLVIVIERFCNYFAAHSASE
jgi:hypothetical protein